MATSTTTSNNRKVSAVRKALLAEVASLKAAVQDPNALMADNAILAALENLAVLRKEYSDVAQVAHDEWCARNL